jgi:hypothetical protein
VCIENLIRIDCVTESPKTSSAMIALLSFFLILLASPFKSKSRFEAENAVFGRQCITTTGPGHGWRASVDHAQPSRRRADALKRLTPV